MPVIFQVQFAKKPKYVREMLYQIHILNTNIANPTLQRAYITNALVNF